MRRLKSSLRMNRCSEMESGGPVAVPGWPPTSSATVVPSASARDRRQAAARAESRLQKRWRSGQPRDHDGGMKPARIGVGSLMKALSPFTARSALDLLTVAACAPGAVHRLPSVALLWYASVRNPPGGGRVAGPDDLARLLTAARRAAPALAEVEAWVPHDPRALVRWALGNERLAVHPGLIEDPLSVVAEAAELAIVDEELVAELGFGIGDLLEVTLRCMDEQLCVLRPGWQLGPVADPAAPASVTQTEIDLAGAFNDPRWAPGGRARQRAALLARCQEPARAAATLAWATKQAARSRPSLDPLRPMFGPLLALDTPRGPNLVPASLMLEGLGAALPILGRHAQRHRSARAAFHGSSLRRLGRLLRRMHADVLGPATVDGVGEVTAIVVPDARHDLAVELVAVADPRQLPPAIAAAAARIGQVHPGAQVRAGAHSRHLSPDAEIVRLVLIAGPGEIPLPVRPGPVVLHLRQFDHVLAEATDTGEVWEFLHELATRPGIDNLLAVDALDVWQTWRTTRVLNPGANQYGGLAFLGAEPSPAWQEAAAWEPFDTLLAAHGLPTTRVWDVRRSDGPGEATLWSLRPPRQALLLRLHPPVMISLPLGPPDELDPRLLVGLGDGLRLAAANVAEFAELLRCCGHGQAVLLRLEYVAGLDAPLPPGAGEDPNNWVPVGIAAARHPLPMISLRFDTRVLQLMASNRATAHKFLGEALALGCQRLAEASCGDAVAAFQAAWADAAPLLMVAFRPVPWLGGRLPPPAEIRPAARARAHRALAGQLAGRGVDPGRWTGAAATRFCNSIVAKALVDLLRDRITVADSAQLLLLATTEVERAVAARTQQVGELEIGLEAPWADTLRRTALRDEPLRQWLLPRAIEFVIELLLAHPSQGDRQLDRLDWADLVALAERAIEIALQSHGAYVGLHDIEVEVGDDHQVVVHPVGEGLLDVDRFHRAQLLEQLRPPQPDDAPGEADQAASAASDPSGPGVEQPFRSFRTLNPPSGLVAVDTVMRQTLGTGIDGLTAVLGTAVSWPPDPSTPVAITTLDRLIDRAATWSGLPHSEIAAAVDLLSLNSSRLTPWSTGNWRSVRCGWRPGRSSSTTRTVFGSSRIGCTPRSRSSSATWMTGGCPGPACPGDSPTRCADIVRDKTVSSNWTHNTSWNGWACRPAAV
jgi:hypothetical protein